VYAELLQPTVKCGILLFIILVGLVFALTC